MSLAAVFDLRDHLASNAELQAFYQDRYGKPCKHQVGYKKTANAADYPSICYVLPESTIGDPSGRRLIVSVVIGVNEPDVVDGVYQGVVFANAAAELVLSALAIGTLSESTVWLGKAGIYSDAGSRHPYYETEIVLPLLWRG